jgi:hypothetical protein
MLTTTRANTDPPNSVRPHPTHLPPAYPSHFPPSPPRLSPTAHAYIVPHFYVPSPTTLDLPHPTLPGPLTDRPT